MKAFILIERVFVCPLPALLAAAQTFDTMGKRKGDVRNDERQ